MKKSLCLETFFPETDFYDRFALAEKAGFEYVEFWLWRNKDTDRIGELCAKHSLKIASFSGDADHSPIDPAQRGAYIDFAEASLERAKALKTPFLVVHSNALGEGGVVLNRCEEKSPFEKFGSLVKTLAELAPKAERSGVTLVLEALNTEVDHAGNFLSTTRDSAAAVLSVGSPNLKILYDVYHMQIMEGNLAGTIRRYADGIGYVHVADVPGRAEPGTGEIEYGKVFSTLSEVGFEGFVGFELFPSKPSAAVASELVELF